MELGGRKEEKRQTDRQTDKKTRQPAMNQVNCCFSSLAFLVRKI